MTSGCGSTSARPDRPRRRHSPDDLKAKALARCTGWQRLPHLVQSFFRDPNLRYITA
jgi:hypothetical protein